MNLSWFVLAHCLVCAIKAHCDFPVFSHAESHKHKTSYSWHISSPFFMKRNKFFSVRLLYNKRPFGESFLRRVTFKGVYLRWIKCYLVFELVGVFVFLLVQVNEVVCNALLAARLHVPADFEGVAGDVADLDVLRNRELLHLRDAAVLGFTSCEIEKHWWYNQCHVYQNEMIWFAITVGIIWDHTHQSKAYLKLIQHQFWIFACNNLSVMRHWSVIVNHIFIIWETWDHIKSVVHSPVSIPSFYSALRKIFFFLFPFLL